MEFNVDTLTYNYGKLKGSKIYKAVDTDNLAPILKISLDEGTSYQFANISKNGIFTLRPCRRSVKILENSTYKVDVFDEPRLNFIKTQKQISNINIDFLHHLSLDNDRTTFIVNRDMFYDLLKESEVLLNSYALKTRYISYFPAKIYKSCYYTVSFLHIDNLVVGNNESLLNAFCLNFEIFDCYKPKKLTPIGVYFIASNTEEGIFFLDGIKNIPINTINMEDTLKLFKFKEVDKKLEVEEGIVKQKGGYDEEGLFHSNDLFEDSVTKAEDTAHLKGTATVTDIHPKEMESAPHIHINRAVNKMKKLKPMYRNKKDIALTQHEIRTLEKRAKEYEREAKRKRLDEYKKEAKKVFTTKNEFKGFTDTSYGDFLITGGSSDTSSLNNSNYINLDFWSPTNVVKK